MPSGAVSRGACNRGHDAARRLLKPPRSPHRSGAPCQGQSPPRLPPPPRQEAGGLGRVAHGFISGDLAGQAVRAIWRAPEKLSQPRGGGEKFWAIVGVAEAGCRALGAVPWAGVLRTADGDIGGYRMPGLEDPRRRLRIRPHRLTSDRPFGDVRRVIDGGR